MTRSRLLTTVISFVCVVCTVLVLAVHSTPVLLSARSDEARQDVRSFTLAAQQLVTETVAEPFSVSVQTPPSAVGTQTQTDTVTTLVRTDRVAENSTQQTVDATDTEYANTATTETATAETATAEIATTGSVTPTTEESVLPTAASASASATVAPTQAQPENDCTEPRGILPPAATFIEDSAAPTVRPLRFGNTVTTYLPSAQDSVTYSLTVTERGAISYTLGYLLPSQITDIGWRVLLYEEYDRQGNSGNLAYRLLNVLTTNTAKKSVTSAKIGVMPGNYRLVLQTDGAYSRDEVTLLAEFTPQTDREIEYNDTPARYTEIYPDLPMTGASGKFLTATQTDADWYLFRMEYDGRAAYTFSHDPIDMISVAWQITLYDADLNELSFNNATLSETTVAGEQVGLEKGIYFICVRGRVHTTADYTLLVETEPLEKYEHESNDSLQTATELAFGDTVTGMMNNRSYGLDYDCFRLDVTQAGYLTLQFRHKAGTEDKDSWNIGLYNADGQLLYTAVSNQTDTVNTSPKLGVAQGTYYIRIDADNLYLSNAEYTVEAAFTLDRHFESEPNNTDSTADVLRADVMRQGSLTRTGLINDCDIYTFTLEQSGSVCIDFTHEAKTIDRIGWHVSLYNADGFTYPPMNENGLPFTGEDGAVLAYRPVNWDENSAKAYYTLPAGTYYVRVDAGMYFTYDTYGITLQTNR